MEWGLDSLSGKGLCGLPNRPRVNHAVFLYIFHLPLQTTHRSAPLRSTRPRFSSQPRNNSIEESAVFLIRMPEDIYAERPLFGGAIASTFPVRFQDVSNIRQVPDHQEVFVDPARDESLIVELLDLKHDVADNGSATWFLQDLASEQDAEGAMVIEQSGVVEAHGLRFRSMPAVVTTAVAQMGISKGRQGREAQNVIRVYLANLRLKEVGTDVLITAYEPILINPLSESASSVGAGLAAPAAESGRMPMAEVFKLAVSSFKVNDWGLFGNAIG